MMQSPIVEPIANISTHLARRPEGTRLRTESQDETAHSRDEALANTVAASTNASAPFAAPPVDLPTNSVDEQPHRTR
jgi:hypothetical protein